MSVHSERHGLLLVDKPTDVTSHDVVAQARKILHQKSVGHTGTLDPLATGLMILVLGEATKLSDYILTADKAYTVDVKLGVTSDTLDRTGQVLSETPCQLDPELVRKAALELQGEFLWPIPIFSAAKVEGRKLYEYGRQGQAIEVPLKTMKFWGVEVEEASSQSARVTLSCSKGSFIRSWAAQLGQKLGVGGLVEELRRVRIGNWDVNQALSLENMASQEDRWREAFVPLARALPDLKPMSASPRDARLMSNGQIPRELSNRLVFEQKQAFATGIPVFVKVVSGAGDLLAILAAEPGQGLKIRRVFRSIA